MPVYSYKCPECQWKEDVIKKLAELDRAEPCGKCGSVMSRQLAAPRVMADYAGYDCPITGKWIEGRKAHEENLKRHGCRLYEPGETEAAKQTIAREEAALESGIESTVEQFIETLPTAKKEQLEKEVLSGLDVNLVRN